MAFTLALIIIQSLMMTLCIYTLPCFPKCSEVLDEDAFFSSAQDSVMTTIIS